MTDALQFLLHLDQEAIRATAELRWGPATGLLTLISAWWVKGPLLIGLGWCSDVARRRVFPLVACAATLSFFLASWLSLLIKDAVGRSRPPEAIGFEALIGIPTSPSFPSGHAMTAFAVAGAVALLAPRLRAPVLALAALIAFSRVYLGVHFWIDVMAGAALGLTIGLVVAWAFHRQATVAVATRGWTSPGDGAGRAGRDGANTAPMTRSVSASGRNELGSPS